MAVKPGRAAALVALAVLTTYLALGFVRLAFRASRAGTGFLRHFGEDDTAAERRVRGAAVAEALGHIRDSIAPGERYFLVDGYPAEDAEAGFRLRFDLAPRQPLFLGYLPIAESERDAWRRRLSAPEGPRYVVVARRNGEAPMLFERTRFLAAIERHSPTDEAKP